MERVFRRFDHRGAAYRIAGEPFHAITAAIRGTRSAIEAYIARHRDFERSLVPLAVSKDAPLIVHDMARAATAAGVGPMAAVAGAIAEAACRAASGDAIVENGGDIYLSLREPATVAIHTAERGGLPLAFCIEPDQTPLAICSSSSRMGHSMSMGSCDVVTVVARDAALADAVATATCNRVVSPDSIDAALQWALNVPGIDGVLIADGDRVGVAGRLPPLVRRDVSTIRNRVTRSR